MTEPRYIDHLNKGAEHWNRWRRSRKSLATIAITGGHIDHIDLSGADLSNVQLTSVNFSQVSFYKADLTGTIISACSFVQVNFDEVSFCKASIVETGFFDSTFQRAKFANNDFVATNFERPNFSEASLRKVSFQSVGFRKPNFTKVRTREFVARGSSFAGAILREAHLDGADFNGADLVGADLYKATLRGADFFNADISYVSCTNGSSSAVDLRSTDFRNALLCGADFRKARLNNSVFEGANLAKANFERADLSDTDLNGIDLSATNLRATKLKNAKLYNANLNSLNLEGVDLSHAYVAGASLRNAKLMMADLSNADLSSADLRFADLRRSFCEGTDFSTSIVLGTKLSQATMTGACLQDWHTNRLTNVEEVVADYVYLSSSYNLTRAKVEFYNRRPHSGSFKADEFAALFQQAINTLDLIFVDGIDWQVFFQSFQDLREQYLDREIAIQAIERKQGGSFIIRLEVPSEFDKSAIESFIKGQYESRLTLVEERYRAELKAKEGEISAYKQQSANLMTIVEKLADRTAMTSEVTQNFHAPVANAAGTNYGSMSALQNNYGSSAEDITRLIGAIRSQVKTFPTKQKEESLDVISALEMDIEQAQPDKHRISRWLKKLMIAGSAVGAIAGSAATFSGNLDEFASNIGELSETLGIPVELIQPSEASGL